jgi:hypothetical protein
MRSLLVAGAVVIAFNALVLFHVARNRAGGPVTTLELSERELALDGSAQELDQSAATSLRVQWVDPARVGIDGSEPTSWFDETKLAELGFDVHVPAGDPAAEEFYRHPPVKTAWVALEPHPESPAQGLTAIDIAADPATLHRRHPAGVMIAPCLARLTHQRTPKPRLIGLIPQLLIREIGIPRTCSAMLEPFRKLPSSRHLAEPGVAPRYAVTLAWGSQFEPWVTQCRVTNPATVR